MKKYSFLVYHKEYTEFLEGIRDLGVVHVIENEAGEIDNEELKYNYQNLNLVNSAIKLLNKRIVEADPKTDKTGIQVAEEVKQLLEEREQINQNLASLQKDKSLLLPWGDFDWDIIDKLEEEDIFIHFYTIQSRNFRKEWLDEYDIEIINDEGGQLYFILIHNKEIKPVIEAEGVGLPEETLSEVIAEITATEQQLEDIEKQLDALATGYQDILESTKKDLTNTVKFDTISLTTPTAAENKVMVLEGWVPKDKEDEIVSFLDISGIYYEADKPVPEDNPPIKLKNGKFSRLFEPVGELYTMPDYKELDLTPFFAPFFMMFFGFCLGDVGYGLLILLAALILRPRVKPQMKSILTLGIFLGAATIFMGLLGGTLFGINLIDSGYTITAKTLAALKASGMPTDVIEKLSGLVNNHFDKQSTFLTQVRGIIGADALASYRYQLLHYVESDYPILNSIRFLMMNTDQLMMLSFAVGAVQTVFGMGIKAANNAKQFGFVHALSTIGWIIVIVGFATLFGLSRANIISPQHFKLYLIIVGSLGGVFIFFMNAPGKNIFLNFGLGVWDTYGMASGLLGDLLSYVRLFALGISSAVLGNVFNQLAFSLSPDIIIVKQLTIILILAFGHGLNLFMSALGSFVHPLRLTFVEFYKNAGFSGGGKKYSPFNNALKIK